MAPPRLLVIDGSNIAAKAFHVASNGREGESIYGLAAYGVKKMGQNLMRQVDPLRVVVALDGDGNFRKDLYDKYKAHRSEKPEELDRLMRNVGTLLQDEIGAEVLCADNHEADDVIATVAQAALPYGWRTTVASSDRDLYQLVCDMGGGAGTFCLFSDRGSYTSIGPDDVRTKIGVPPLRVAMWKAIAGDPGDNLPGVPSLGPVAAKRLASEYRTPKQLFENLGRLQKSDRTKLEAAGREYLELMLDLVTLRADAPLRCPAPGV